MTPTIRAALIRAARTAGQAFLAVLVAKWVAGAPAISVMYHEAIDNADFAAGTAVLAALGSFGLNVKRPISPEAKG